MLLNLELIVLKNTILGILCLSVLSTVNEYFEALTLEVHRLRILVKCSVNVDVADAHKIHIQMKSLGFFKLDFNDKTPF